MKIALKGCQGVVCKHPGSKERLVNVGLYLGLELVGNFLRLHPVVLCCMRGALGEDLVLRLALCHKAALKSYVLALEF